MQPRPPSLAPRLPDLRERLREATRAEHHSLDQSISMLDLGDALEYGEFLRIQLTALDELAPFWAAVDAGDFSALQCRLAQDLQLAYGSDVAPRTLRTPELSRAAQWGLAYVIRGSRLGSKVLSARVPSSFSTQYLDYLPETTWPHFLADLQHAAETFDADTERQVVDGAKLAFTAYAGAALRVVCNRRMADSATMSMIA